MYEKHYITEKIDLIVFFLSVSTARPRERLRTDISKVKLNELCEIRSSKTSVVVTFFVGFLHAKVTDAMKRLLDVKTSNVFVEIWKQLGKKAQNKRKTDSPTKGFLSIVDVVHQILIPAYEQWDHVANGVLKGNITLQSIDKHLAKLEERPNELERELRLMMRWCSKEMVSAELANVLRRRLTELRTYQQLRGCSVAAREICNFKKAMSLKGDFQAVEDLMEQVRLSKVNKCSNFSRLS